MNDKIIINTISEIYLIIVSFISFIIIGCSLFFLFLLNGISLQEIALPNLKIEKLYIKWEEKLNISIQEIQITTAKDTNSSFLSYEEVQKSFKKLHIFESVIESITVDEIFYNDINGSLSYKNEHGYIKVEAQEFSLQAKLSKKQNLLDLTIQNFEYYPKEIKLQGDVVIDFASKELDIASKLDLNIHNDVELRVYSLANQESIHYKVLAKKKIKNIAYTVKMLALPKEIEYWALDAITLDTLELNTLYGFVTYSKLQEAYKNVHVEATVHNLSYIYNTKVQPIVSKNTTLLLDKGVFRIYPHQAYTYNYYLGKSWIEVDFTQSEELLSINLDIPKAQLNKDILYLLSTYHINLPFLQKTGSVSTKLQININLRTIDVSAQGEFFTKKANFDYLGLNLNIYNALIKLDNYEVSIKNMFATYSDVVDVRSDVDVYFNAKDEKGIIDFKVKSIAFQDVDLSLQNTKQPLKVSYKIQDGLDSIDVDASQWKFLSKDVKVKKLRIPLNTDTLSLKIPSTLLRIPNELSLYAKGEVLLNPMRINLTLDMFALNMKGITLAQKHAPLKFLYKEHFTLLSDNEIKFHFNNMEYLLTQTKADIKNNALYIQYGFLGIKDMLDTKFSALYNFKTSLGHVDLKYIILKNDALGEIYYNPKQRRLHLDYSTQDLKINSKKLNIDFTLQDKGWKLHLNSFKTLQKYSKIFQDYNISNGSATIYADTNDENIYFQAQTTYPYKLLTKEGVPTDIYDINGTYNTTIKLDVNKNMHVDINDTVTINAHDIGINLDAVFNFFNDRKDTGEKKETPKVLFNADTSYLYIGENRRIISDKMYLQYYNDITTAQLLYGDGKANLEFYDKKFHVYGENFNDTFMENLFALSKFQKGSLAFSMNGTTQEYDGLFYLQDTTIVKYKVLNNVLAFVNTIPSLMTFSLPSYDSKGLKVSSAYMSFHAKDDQFDINDVYLDSPELDILGKGRASIKYNSIDLKLNLRTDLGSSIAKIPVVGYILLGEDAVSTTLKISGPLDNPKVESLLAEDIIVAPLNIIKRTFMLPFHLFSDKKDKKKQ